MDFAPNIYYHGRNMPLVSHQTNNATPQKSILFHLHQDLPDIRKIFFVEVPMKNIKNFLKLSSSVCVLIC